MFTTVHSPTTLAQPSISYLSTLAHPSKSTQEHQHQNGHSGLYVCSTGLYVSTSHPFLATSPDGAIYDATASHPYEFLEIKCPFSQRHLSPVEACGSRGFCCEIEEDLPKWHRTHPYYSQVQGQMAIGGRMCCDFVNYTKNGIRIPFAQTFWERELLPKRVCFWEYYLAPEIVT